MPEPTPSPVQISGTPHTIWEDAYALVTGCFCLVLGLVFLKSAGLVTGGVAGLALLVSYLVPVTPGVLLVLLNVPFFWFAWKAMGRSFAIKTMLVNAGIGIFSIAAEAGLHVDRVHPLFAAIVGGTVIGLGILIVARHAAGVGGNGIVTLWLQKTRGINAGRTQVAIDIVILLVSIPVVETAVQFAWSVLSAVAISVVLMVWHRPGRYTGH